MPLSYPSLLCCYILLDISSLPTPSYCLNVHARTPRLSVTIVKILCFLQAIVALLEVSVPRIASHLLETLFYFLAKPKVGAGHRNDHSQCLAMAKNTDIMVPLTRYLIDSISANPSTDLQWVAVIWALKLPELWSAVGTLHCMVDKGGPGDR